MLVFCMPCIVKSVSMMPQDMGLNGKLAMKLLTEARHQQVIIDPPPPIQRTICRAQERPETPYMCRLLIGWLTNQTDILEIVQKDRVTNVSLHSTMCIMGHALRGHDWSMATTRRARQHMVYDVQYAVREATHPLYMMVTRL